MTRYVLRNGDLVEKWRVAPPRRPRAFYIAGDEHEPFQSMADGKWYDSKSVYRRSLKDHGMIEVGNDTAAHNYGSRPGPSEADIEQSIAEACDELGITD